MLARPSEGIPCANAKVKPLSNRVCRGGGAEGYRRSRHSRKRTAALEWMIPVGLQGVSCPNRITNIMRQAMTVLTADVRSGSVSCKSDRVWPGQLQVDLSGTRQLRMRIPKPLCSAIFMPALFHPALTFRLEPFLLKTEGMSSEQKNYTQNLGSLVPGNSVEDADNRKPHSTVTDFARFRG